MPKKISESGGAKHGAAKRPYATPRLTAYGDLRKIVMAKRSNRSDGARVPATKR